MRKEDIEIDGVKFTLKTHVEKRNNFRASLRGENINIRIPRFVSPRDRERYVSETINKLSKTIRLNPELKPKKKKTRSYENGDLLKLGSEEYRIEIRQGSGKSSSARMRGDTIRIILAADITDEERQSVASTLVSRCVAKERLPRIEARVRELNDIHFKKEVNNVRLKNTKTRWGSCSTRGNINLSTRLLFAPDDVIDYVIIHELAHLVEPNHSPKFWKLVERAEPDYKEKKKWLKENSRHLYF